MKNVLGLAAMAAVVALGVGATSAYADSAVGTASVTIVDPVAVSNQRNLSFGTVAPNATGGTVGVEATDAGTVHPSGVQVLAPVTSGHVAIKAASGFLYSASVDGTIQLNGPGTLWASLGLDRAGDTGTGNWQDFYVGGTLTLPANTPSGGYAGNYNVTANYN